MSSYRIQFQQGVSLPEFLDRFGPGTTVPSDGLGWFAGVIDAGCALTPIVVGARMRREMPRFTWVNTLPANLRAAVKSAHEHFASVNNAHAHLGAFAYRFNHRVHLSSLITELFFDLAEQPLVVSCGKRYSRSSLVVEPIPLHTT